MSRLHQLRRSGAYWAVQVLPGRLWAHTLVPYNFLAIAGGLFVSPRFENNNLGLKKENRVYAHRFAARKL